PRAGAGVDDDSLATGDVTHRLLDEAHARRARRHHEARRRDQLQAGELGEPHPTPAAASSTSTSVVAASRPWSATIRTGNRCSGGSVADASMLPPRPRRRDSQIPSIPNPISATTSRSANAIQASALPPAAT